MFSIEINKEPQSNVVQNVISNTRVLARQVAHELPQEPDTASVVYDTARKGGGRHND